MLLSTVLTLQPTEPASVPANLGREAHAWFLARVADHDPALAERLHTGQGPRPFTVSNLWGLDPARGPAVPLHPGRTYALRLTSLSPDLTALLRDRLLPALPPALTLAGARLRIVSAAADPAAHPWAAQATYPDLVQQFTLSADPPRSAGLRFASPAAFRVTGRTWPVALPLPGLVFGGLLDRWNAFSPLQLHPDLRRFAEERVTLSAYRLQTRRLAFGDEGERGSVTGFVGHAWYGFEVRDRYWMGLVHLLAAFSLFSGAGLRTTMGMGQMRKMEET